MSYSPPVLVIHPGGDPAATLTTHLDDYLAATLADGTTLETLTWWPTAEVRDHFTAIVDAVTSLLRFVGRDDDTVRVTISGHANPGHAPADGYADEFIRVLVEVIREEQ